MSEKEATACIKINRLLEAADWRYFPSAAVRQLEPGNTRPARRRASLAARHLPALGYENSQPTFRYSLLDGVKERYLINPTVVGARTGITTQLLSDEGFVVSFTDDTGNITEAQQDDGEPFEEKMKRLTATLYHQQAEAAKLDAAIAANLKELGYDG